MQAQKTEVEHNIHPVEVIKLILTPIITFKCHISNSNKNLRNYILKIKKIILLNSEIHLVINQDIGIRLILEKYQIYKISD